MSRLANKEDDQSGLVRDHAELSCLYYGFITNDNIAENLPDCGTELAPGPD